MSKKNRIILFLIVPALITIGVFLLIDNKDMSIISMGIKGIITFILSYIFMVLSTPFLTDKLK